MMLQFQSDLEAHFGRKCIILSTKCCCQSILTDFQEKQKPFSFKMNLPVKPKKCKSQSIDFERKLNKSEEKKKRHVIYTVSFLLTFIIFKFYS